MLPFFLPCMTKEKNEIAGERLKGIRETSKTREYIIWFCDVVWRLSDARKASRAPKRL
jgi:hypothetical protein